MDLRRYSCPFYEERDIYFNKLRGYGGLNPGVKDPGFSTGSKGP